MKAKLCAVLLAIGGLTACGGGMDLHEPNQAIAVDDHTWLVVKTEGARVRSSEIGGTLPVSRSREPVHRVFETTGGKVLFAYDLEITPGASDTSWRFLLKPAAVRPTFAASREVMVNAEGEGGERVRVELMEQPETGEKIVDVFQLVRRQRRIQERHEFSLNSLHRRLYQFIHGQ